jgi:ATP-dependent Lon protease
MVKENNIIQKIHKKIDYYLELIQKTHESIQLYQKNEIYNSTEYLHCVKKLNNIYSIITNTKKCNDDNINTYIENLQEINNIFSIIFKKYGTKSLEDLIKICIGNNFIDTIEDSESSSLLKLLLQYTSPVFFIVKTLDKNKNDDDDNIKINCSDLSYFVSNFYLKVNGIKIEITMKEDNKTKIYEIHSIVQDTLIDCINVLFIQDKINYLKNNTPNIEHIHNNEIYKQFISNTSLKDLLIYKIHEFYERYSGYLNKIKLFRQKSLSQTVKEFLNNDLFYKRNFIILLLMYDYEPEYQYTAYLLYDLLNNDEKTQLDSNTQKTIFNSFPYNTKIKFREAIKTTIEYTKSLTDINNKQIPLEQQICLMKASDKVKTKAIIKLKEIKTKGEDTGSKARNYLEGLLKIPFGIYKNEDTLQYIKKFKSNFTNFINTNSSFIKEYFDIDINNNVFSIPEIYSIINKIRSKLFIFNNDNQNFDILNNFMNHTVKKYNRKQLIFLSKNINNINKSNTIFYPKIKTTNKLNKQLIQQIHDYIKFIIINHENIDSTDFSKQFTNIIFNIDNNVFYPFYNSFYKINNEFVNSKNKLEDITNILDKSVYGHTKAKRQVERIIGQWMTGKQNGYCFGFEGPPGVGKCHAYNSEILMYDGSIKYVQDINVGDLLMGDDSTPRKVLSLARGKDIMYNIIFSNKEFFTVNKEHILCLKFIGKKSSIDRYRIRNKIYYIASIFDFYKVRYYKLRFDSYNHALEYINTISKYFPKDNVVEIPVKEYIKLDDSIKRQLKCYRTNVLFNNRKTRIEPYDYGYNICFYREKNIREKNYYKDNKLFDIDNIKLYENIDEIDKDYLINNTENRLKLLNGIIDSSKYYSKNKKHIRIKLYNVKIIDDIVFLVKSLGYHIDFTFKYTSKKPLYIINIYGKHITNLSSYIYNLYAGVYSDKYTYPYNYFNNHKIINIYNFTVEQDKEQLDDYYGFELDKNKRYIMGDFTVTHNTSLAKNGLSKCLVDTEGNYRPFGFIALGGSSNGSTIEGHNYTYVGSTWGRIVDILMESKCMNPIIFIDELDKVSKTEHGKEIIGILTHLIDSTQNDTFQDKYFSGIDLDLSKVLFIFSYNDVSLIDKILLDRIHRVKFDNLTLHEKITISYDYLLPEIYNNINISKDIIQFPKNVLTYIIEKYTYEPGVRKLKEILFEIISEINLEFLYQSYNNYEIPIVISIDDIKDKYLVERKPIIHKTIHNIPQVGIINGLWANSLGFGGIIPIQSNYFPSKTFMELKLTGSQGDVMKESMNVAKTIACELTPNMEISKYENKGIHIHCPEGATPKDGPSAGTAITVSLYSLFNNLKIKNDIAITGEINLQGYVTAIGGLDLKILGGIKAGVKTFIYPSENKREFEDFNKKYDTIIDLTNISFYSVSHIDEVLKLCFI